MNFVRFGEEVINLELVTHASVKEDKVTLYFSGWQSSLGKEVPLVKHYEGDKAKALYNFLMKNSQDLNLGPEEPKSPSVYDYYKGQAERPQGE